MLIMLLGPTVIGTLALFAHRYRWQRRNLSVLNVMSRQRTRPQISFVTPRLFKRCR